MTTVLLYLLLLIYLLWKYNTNFADFIIKHITLRGRFKQEDDYLAILLQPSPVDTKQQPARLEIIDKGWSTWTKQSNKSIQVFASSWLTNNKVGKYSNINIVPLSTSSSAIDNMIEFFVFLLFSPTISHYKWYVYGNDHTFFVPLNLMCYLDQFESASLFYSGNKLQRGKYRNKNLQFASGGAGVIISSTSMKLLLSAWTLSFNKYLRPYIISKLDAENYCPPPTVARFIDGELVKIFQTGDSHQFLCAIKAMLDHRNMSLSNAENNDAIKTLQVVISPRISLISSKAIVDDAATLKLQLYDTENEQLIQIQEDTLQLCNDYSDWAVINPGIVVAYCLQHVLHTTFIDSKARDNSERFNVYGVVRSVVNEFDDWYIEAKLGLNPGYIDRSKRNPEGPLNAVPNSIKFLPSAEELVSFHYVSQHESNLMYQIISKKITLKSPDHLLSIWPSTDTDIGHYSRKIKNVDEAKVLFHYITSIVHRIHNCK